uniref:Uncharacterized protein n=1 Tax=Anguilla anguilla TaxID=7936 RepID=A0A0E9Q1M9_ANGAN
MQPVGHKHSPFTMETLKT